MKRRTIKKRANRRIREVIRGIKLEYMEELKELYNDGLSFTEMRKIVMAASEKWGSTIYGARMQAAIMVLIAYSPKKFPRWSRERREMLCEN